MDAPYIWEWEEDGIRRQAKIHVTEDGDTVVWSPRYPGDYLPWLDAAYGDGDSDRGRYEDADLVTLGVPATHADSFDY